MSLRVPQIALLVLASVLFALRGPARVVNQNPLRRTDLVGPYLGSRLWLHGENPYIPEPYWKMWDASGFGTIQHEDLFDSRIAYPLTALALLAPAAGLSWAVFRLVVMAATVLLMVAGIVALARVPALRRNASSSWPVVWFIALGVTLGPLQTAVGTGNLAGAAGALLALSVWALLDGREKTAAVALCLSLCLKPTLGIPVLAYLVLRRPRVAWLAVGLTALVLGVAAARLAAAGTPWLADFVANERMLLPGHGDDIIHGSATQRQFLNLQFLASQLFTADRAVAVFAIGIGGALVLTWLVLVAAEFRVDAATGPARRSPLLALSTITVISLLPVYHRSYDAVVLLLPLCWCLSEAAPRWRALVLVCLLPFLLPAGTYFEMQAEAGNLPLWLTTHWTWTTVVVPHQVWALLAMAIILLAAQTLSVVRRPVASAIPARES